MSDNEVFMQVNELGDLYLYDVLLAYIYPRIFVCEDIYDSKYLFYEVGNGDDTDTWLVAKITKEEYYSLIDKKESVQNVYEKKSSFNLFTVSKKYGDEFDIINLSYDVKDWSKKLPAEPVFVEKELLDDEGRETLEAARTTGATTFDIRLFPGSDRHFVPQNIMSNLCTAMTSLTESIFGKRRGEALHVATAPGSCIVRFSFTEKVNVFNEKAAVHEMDVINDVLSAKSVSEELGKVKNRNRFINSYSKILDCIRKTNSDVRFSTATPNSTKVRKIELSKEMIRSRYEDIKDIHKVETTDVRVKGILIALDTKTGTFKLELADGSVKAGTVERAFLTEKTFEIPGTYEATLNIERISGYSREDIREKYSLKDLIAM